MIARFVMAFLLLGAFLAAPLSAHAANTMTRVGQYVGAKNIIIKRSLEEDMLRAGIPQQCRTEAHEVLTQFVFYGYDTDPRENPTLDILCAFESKAAGDGKGMLGQAIGQRGTVGGVRYLHFKSKSRNVQRYILPPKSQTTSSRFAHLLYLAATGSAGGTNLACAASGTCGGAGVFATPINGARITSNFGGRTSPGGVGSTDHKGMDYSASCGTPIQSAADGVIITSKTQITRKPNGKTGGAGNYCQVRHANGIVTEYFHMENLSQCKPGAVKQGQVIGTVGNTGGSTGCHLHFGTLVNGQRVDPRGVVGKVANVPLTAEQQAQLQTAMASVDNAVSLLPATDFLDGGGAAAGDIKNGYATGTSVLRTYGEDELTPPEDDHDHEEGDGHDH